MDDQSVMGGILRTAMALDDEVEVVPGDSWQHPTRGLRREGTQGMREACERLGAICRGLEADAILARTPRQGSACMLALETEGKRAVA